MDIIQFDRTILQFYIRHIKLDEYLVSVQSRFVNNANRLALYVPIDTALPDCHPRNLPTNRRDARGASRFLYVIGLHLGCKVCCKFKEALLGTIILMECF